MSASDSVARRFTCGSGILATLCFGVVAGCLINVPDVTIDGASVLEWGANNRTILLTAVYFEGLCVMCTFGFMIGLYTILRKSEGTTGLWSTLGVMGGCSIFTVALGGMVFLAAFAFRAGATNGSAGAGVITPELARLLIDMSGLMICLTGFPTAISQFGYALSLWTIPAQRISYSSYLAYSGVAIGVAHMVSGGCFSTSAGMLSPAGLGVYVCPVLYYIWFVAVSICLVITPMEDRAMKTDSISAGRAALLEGQSPDLTAVQRQ